MEILDAFEVIQKDLPLIFPAHPRTKQRIQALKDAGKYSGLDSLHLIEPVGYLEFIALERDAKVILTDSGGIQEESTVLGIPCLTLRENTERPVTVTVGTNRLVDPKKDDILRAIKPILEGAPVSGKIPEKWDGKAAERIVDVLLKIESGS